MSQDLTPRERFYAAALSVAVSAAVLAVPIFLVKAYQKFDGDIRAANAQERIAAALEQRPSGHGYAHLADFKPIPDPDQEPCDGANTDPRGWAPEACGDRKQERIEKLLREARASDDRAMQEVLKMQSVVMGALQREDEKEFVRAGRAEITSLPTLGGTAR